MVFLAGLKGIQLPEREYQRVKIGLTIKETARLWLGMQKKKNLHLYFKDTSIMASVPPLKITNSKESYWIAGREILESWHVSLLKDGQKRCVAFNNVIQDGIETKGASLRRVCNRY
uniref:AlNc14C96G5882 protein n=1 Tax=Albugo laibachii Nc14 TaxID=890382 RepID=F0WH07_9STRA|nr:AlNc14C96G5882 [Albugo laibachii Nc14]|eukprot:CCA20522.1 AlNc14C96G5882 [Albugo laibachii Nc14]